MNFDDRLRSQLRAQSDDLSVTSEGIDGVRARSRRRKQQRTGGVMLATVAVALLAGGWIIGQSGDDGIQVATDGDGQGGAVADVSVTGAPANNMDIDDALPDAGTPLTLTPADTDNAPGGYNLYQTGRADGLYFVVSTAPGVTWEDNESNDYIRPDTFYTFDGSSWSQNNVGDRYVSSFDTGANGVLYAVSTGSPTDQSLEIGSSANGGRDWAWTEIDLSPMFGEDPATWPPYTVQFADRGDERLVVVHTNGNVDWDEATTLAIDNGAGIDRATQEVVNVDRNGIVWIDRFDGATFGFEQSPCEAGFSDAMSAFWDTEVTEPEFDFGEDRPISDAERQQIQAFEDASRARYSAAEAEALQSVARIPGCETFVKCTTEMNTRQNEISDLVSEVYAEMGIDLYSFESGMTDEQYARIDALYAEHETDLSDWVIDSGCEDIFPYMFEGEVTVTDEEMVEPEFNEQYASWESLGVNPPESWNEINRAFLVDGASVTDLGEVFGDQIGYLIDVETTADRWSVTFDSSTWTNNNFEESDQQYTRWTSIDGIDWSSETTATFDWNQAAALADGTTLSVNWTEAGSELVRRGPDGSANRLALADLAADFDTSQFELVNVKTGEYGAIAWAVKWPDFNEQSGESIGTYESIVLYSPDGVGWGATEVSDVEVVDVIVGEDNALIFLNDPQRAEGTPQPIMLASAE